uniref:PPM-type phosphatase domain-containing protein n=1 Tax=Physcomitrium patens TaxID=3218 RepID=A0A2K1KFI1_PHYPA|nr:hypothetical protein PHYPA_008912 [Physcomitrium patens]
MSWSFGVRVMKKYFVAGPEIQKESIISDGELLVIASKGVHDVVSNQDVEPNPLRITVATMLFRNPHRRELRSVVYQFVVLGDYLFIYLFIYFLFGVSRQYRRILLCC